MPPTMLVAFTPLSRPPKFPPSCISTPRAAMDSASSRAAKPQRRGLALWRHGSRKRVWTSGFTTRSRALGQPDDAWRSDQIQQQHALIHFTEEDAVELWIARHCPEDLGRHLQ